MTQHRSCRQECLGGGREPGHPGENDRRKLPRSRESTVLTVQSRDPDLIEQRPTVESVSFCVRSQASCRSFRQCPKPKRSRQVNQVRRVQAS